MTTLHEDRLRRRKDRLESMGLTHPEDAYSARPSDTYGVGRLRKADCREGRLQVEVESGGVLLYIDTTNPRIMDALFNLERLEIGARVTFSASIRSLGSRGVRLGSLTLLPCDAPIDKATFRPKARANGLIRLGEGDMKDPDPKACGFFLVPENLPAVGVRFVPIQEG